MILGWWKRRRRLSLQQRPFLPAWQDALDQNVAFYPQLTDAEQLKARRYLQVFIAEKHWEGCRGFAITDEVRATIAGQVAIMVLGFDVEEYFDAVQSILVYPDAYVAPGRTVTRAGTVIEGGSAREGEAWYRGPVILSWVDALAGGRREYRGHNLVFHEFAHQLDMLNGHVTDGMPPMSSPQQYQRWSDVTRSRYERLSHDCRHRQPALLDCYGATSLSEFFAVASETFFSRPRYLQRRDPELYDLFRDYYRQDPAQRGATDGSAGEDPAGD